MVTAKRRSPYLRESLFGQLPPSPRYTGLVLLMSVASLLVSVATFLHPALAWLLVR